MTHSHQTDQQVLAELINRQYAYIGVLGSTQLIGILNYFAHVYYFKWCML
ncbi:hypothetical protein [Methyloprofundus sedimenti]